MIANKSDRPNSKFKTIIQHHSLSSFFILTFFLSWVFWIPLILLINKYGEDDITDYVSILILLILVIGLYIGLYSPAISAIIITSIDNGKPGLKEFFSRVFKWRVELRWYVLTVLFSLSIFFVASFIYVLLGGSYIDDISISLFSLTLLFVDLFLIHGGQEELGWRGFAQPKLQIQYTSIQGTIILGILWAFWHLPFFFLDSGQYTDDDSPIFNFVLFLFGAIAISFLYTIIYNNTQSTFLVMLFHTLFNLFSEIIPPENTLESISYYEVIDIIGVVLFFIFLGISVFSSDRIKRRIFPKLQSSLKNIDQSS